MLESIIVMTLLISALVVLATQVMVKSASRVQRKMKERVSVAGTEVVAGFEDAKDPIDVALSDIKGHEEKMKAGLAEAMKAGKVQRGLERAKKRDSWKKSAERAGRHYEERADDMVTNYMDDYDKRAAIIAKAQDEIKKMPKATFEQRMARQRKYAELTHKAFSD